MRKAEKAYELFNTLNPINRSSNVEDADIYKCEPYVMTGDIYSNPNHMARGGWSWYTGSAGWLYQSSIEDILGFKKFSDHFILDPVIPKEWEGFNMSYNYEGTRYNIKVERGIYKGLSINGNKVEDDRIPLREDAGEIEVNLVI
jgi:cellobiose phosphorylase